jgi:hypothetical protein
MADGAATATPQANAKAQAPVRNIMRSPFIGPCWSAEQGD